MWIAVIIRVFFCRKGGERKLKGNINFRIESLTELRFEKHASYLLSLGYEEDSGTNDPVIRKQLVWLMKKRNYYTIVDNEVVGMSGCGMSGFEGIVGVI